MDDATCETCPHAKYSDEKRSCHRYAPKPSDRTKRLAWPVVDPNQWCGEHPLRQARASQITTREAMRLVAEMQAVGELEGLS